ncbi:imidazole glycerol phosphate synthase subunit HisH [Candidatus Woesearchaeota archaeon]|nr:imidazole glycerol phosphate synthase subunit HisH [Candidatus Woesearchaeota archaeon]
MISIIDYGAGNTGSVKNALDNLGFENQITDDKKSILGSDKVIFPGVGNFGDVIKSLEKKDLIRVIKRVIQNDIPFLGICVGYQVLFENSEESPGIKGMGIFKGDVIKFRSENLKIPQIGWNRIKIEKKNSKIMKNIPDNSFVYFVHSFFPEVKNENIVLARTNYGQEFVSAIERGNVYATQFHPEKSGKIGLRILSNFCRL